MKDKMVNSNLVEYIVLGQGKTFRVNRVTGLLNEIGFYFDSEIHSSRQYIQTIDVSKFKIS